MAAGITEHLDKQIGAAVDDLGRIVEVRRCIDHAQELDDEVDSVERAERIAHGGKQAQSDQTRTPIALVDADIDAELASELFAIGVARPLPGEIKNVSGEPVRQIIGDWLAKLRQHDAELFKRASAPMSPPARL